MNDSKERNDKLQALMNASSRIMVPEGENMLQRNASARMREVACDNDPWGHPSMGHTDYREMEKDWKARSDFRRQMVNPGGMTFKKGSVLPPKGE